MLQAMDPDAITDYSLPDDIENPSVFHLRTLSGRQYARVVRLMDTDADGRIVRVTPEAATEALVQGLRGWSNFPAEWDKRDPLRNVDRLDDAAFAALSRKILQLATLPEDQAGK